MRLLLVSAMLGLPLASCSAETEQRAQQRGVAGTDTAPTEVIVLSVADLERFAAEDAYANGVVTLIDIRTPEETALGMIPGARAIPLDAFEPAALTADAARTVVFYSRSGRRSALAAERYAEHTGKPARHLEGGILAWQDAGNKLFIPYVIE